MLLCSSSGAFAQGLDFAQVTLGYDASRLAYFDVNGSGYSLSARASYSLGGNFHVQADLDLNRMTLDSFTFNTTGFTIHPYMDLGNGLAVGTYYQTQRNSEGKSSFTANAYGIELNYEDESGFGAEAYIGRTTIGDGILFESATAWGLEASYAISPKMTTYLRTATGAFDEVPYQMNSTAFGFDYTVDGMGSSMGPIVVGFEYRTNTLFVYDTDTVALTVTFPLGGSGNVTSRGFGKERSNLGDMLFLY